MVSAGFEGRISRIIYKILSMGIQDQWLGLHQTLWTEQMALLGDIRLNSRLLKILVIHLKRYLFHNRIVVQWLSNLKLKYKKCSWMGWMFQSLKKTTTYCQLVHQSLVEWVTLVETPPRCTQVVDGARMRSNQVHLLWRSPRCIDVFRCPSWKRDLS